MLIRPHRRDLALITFYVGRVVTGLAVLILLPLPVAVVLREWNDVTAILTGGGLAMVLGQLSAARFATREPLEWSHGLVTVALAWFLGPLLLAVPLYLSGHFGSFLDAFFDAMSGLTTSGLSLAQDLDHLSIAMQYLRHLSHFAGGQGIVVVVLSVLSSSAAQLQTLYVGEGRDDRIVPNVVRTARFIYRVAVAYALVGIPALVVAGLVAGLSPGRAVFHGINIFMAAFDTGGFSPHSTSIAYYHSLTFEAVVSVLMLAGAFSFALHYELWRRRVGEATRNLELRAFLLTILATTAVTLLGLARSGVYDRPADLWRRGLFTILSAHTGTGFTVIAAQDYALDWGRIAPAIVVVTMALGGMAGSTAGGMKMIRVAVATKSVLRDIRQVIAPGAAVVVASYEARGRRIIRDRQVRLAVTLIVLYLLLYLAGALVGVAYDVTFERAMFESTSAAANVGLSNGVLSPDNPLPLKWTFVLQMYLGRLEFMAAFALVGYAIASFRGRL